MNLKNLIPFSIFFLEACQGQPAPLPASLPPIGDGPQMCGGPDPVLAPVFDKTDEILAQLNETNRILEECVMPAHGLYPKTQTCDMPPSSCQEGDAQ